MDKGNLLESWKEIAAHLNKNVRTCQMWERDHGLPVHRLDGSPKARVFAYSDELDRWFAEKLHEREPKDPLQSVEKKPAVLPTLARWNALVIASIGLIAVAAVAACVWLVQQQGKIRWVGEVAIPEIERLLKTKDRKTPFELLLRAEKILPESSRLASLKPLVVAPLTFETEPSGAEISIRDYDRGGDPWIDLGRSPIIKAGIWHGYWRFRAVKAGCADVEGAFFARAGYNPEIRIALDKKESVPDGMIRVAGGRPMIIMPGLLHVSSVDLPDFFIDRFEVTNRQYKAFVDAGGYSLPEFWEEKFEKDGTTIPWEEGIREFVDATGRPGPASWRLGGYPRGWDDHPVSGVSWYEADAYAGFAGKRLPTCFHWIHAAGDYHVDSAHMVPASNLEGEGPAAAGSFQGLSSTGAYDMAGNVKEWCSNRIAGKRPALGAAWNENQYFFADADRYPPMMRAENFGFRCMKEIPGREAPAAAFRDIEGVMSVDYWAMKPCPDGIFEVYRGLFGYTKGPLEARLESVTEWSEDTRIEKVSFWNAVGDDRVIAYLFLPRRGRRPFQTVVFYPGGGAWELDSIFDYGPVRNREVEIFTRGGRAFVFPVYKGTFERREKSRPPSSRQRRRDAIIREYREIGRCLDYLETRPDVDRDKLAYHGLSGGGTFGVIFAALEPRFKAAALLAGGLYWVEYAPELYAPERDAVHFAPRVRIPVLMQNGKYDFLMPFEDSVKRLFALLGTPPADRRLIGYESGHSVWLVNEYRKDMLDFFDKYLGPVR